MGLIHNHEGKSAYSSIDRIGVEKRIHQGGISTNDPNFVMPPMLNIMFKTYDKKGGKALCMGGLSSPLDLNAKESIYAIAYRELKEKVPELKDAKDDI